MAAPLQGIRVLEVANWLAAPSATALMADLGADVIKVEPPGGDHYRGYIMRTIGYDYDFETNYAFQADNRGKRSITVALDRPGGPALVRRLASGADIFVSNLVDDRVTKFGLGFDDLRTASPRIVYVSFSGYGRRGPDASRPGFDYAAFWARSGIMGMLADPDDPPPLGPRGIGDHTTALNILASTLAALRLRDMTGEAQHVEVTLQATGLWVASSDIQAALIAKQLPARHDRHRPVNPVWNSYRCAGGDWVLLIMPQPESYWPRFCEMIGRPEWVADERYNSVAKRKERTDELTAQIDASFAAHDFAYWSAKLDEYGLIWAPVSKLTDVIRDPQAHEMGWFTTIQHPIVGAFETLATPFHIYGADVGIRGPAPEAGAHTHEVLSEFGISEEGMARLASDGVLG